MFRKKLGRHQTYQLINIAGWVVVNEEHPADLSVSIERGQVKGRSAFLVHYAWRGAY